LDFLPSHLCIISASVRAFIEKSITVFMFTSPMKLRYMKGRLRRDSL